MRAAWTASFGFLLFASCARHTEQSSEPRTAASAPMATSFVGASSRGPGFHVAVVEAERDDAPASWRRAEPCPLHARTLVCGFEVPLVSDAEGLRADSVLEQAHAAAHVPGPVAHVFGRWPDATWMVTYDSDADEPAGRVHVHAFRWVAEGWKPYVGWTGVARPGVPWDEGFLTDGARHGDHADHGHFSYFVPGGERPAPAIRLLEPGVMAEADFEDVAAIDGTLFLVATTTEPRRLMVEQRTPGGASHMDDLGPELGSAKLWAHTAQDVVAFGGSRHANEEPLLTRWDGKRWTPMPSPPGVDFIVAYGRDDGGTERVFAFRGKELSLWEHVGTSDWRSVPLPVLAPGEEIDRQWVTDEDAWLHVTSSARAGRLLRLRPVKEVVYMSASGPRFVPATGAGDPPPAVPVDSNGGLSGDPSLFRDAVLGAKDRVDAELANGLTLCPLEGRTFVCGLPGSPLVSTEDGVTTDRAGDALPHGEVTLAAYGSWPGDAWFVTATLGTMGESAFHGSAGKPARVARWGHGRAQVFAPWGGGLLVTNAGPGEGEPERSEDPLRFFTPGGHASSPASALVDRRRGHPADGDGLVAMASAGGTAFLVGDRAGKVMVERWLPGYAQPRRLDTVLRHAEGDAHLHAAVRAFSASDAVVFGDLEVSDVKTPVLSRFDGKAWSALDVPPGAVRVAAYDRRADGTEWIFTVSPSGTSLFTRTNGAWTPVLLPRLAPGDRIHDAWLVNDDAWILVWPEDLTKSPPRLLRTRPVKKVWSAPRELPALLGW